MEKAGMVLVAVATLVLGLAAMSGPLKSVSRVWLTVGAVTIAAAMILGSQLASMAAATALVIGVPIAGLVVLAWAKTVEQGKAG